MICFSRHTIQIVRAFYIQQLLCFMCFSIESSSVFAAESDMPSIEVSHWWTSGSEAKAMDVLKQEISKKGYRWKENGSISGGGGALQRRVLKERMRTHTPPDSLLLQGNSMSFYAASGWLRNLDDYANRQGWAQLFPKPIQSVATYQGHWMAIPVNMHRSNWIWANKAIFDELKLVPPHNFKELISMAEKIRQAGYVPLAHGGQPWQDVILFDTTLLAVGGASFYQKALIEHDPKSLGSPMMRVVFDHLRQLTTLFDADAVERDWNLATAMVIHKKAAMQMMGDWAKGEFYKAGKLPNKDYLCFEYPGTQGRFVFVSDVFGMLKAPQSHEKAQEALINVMVDKHFQEAFNLAKGSIPARIDTDMSNFDDCAKKSHMDFLAALKTNHVVRHFDTSVTDEQRAVIYKVVSTFMHHPAVSSAEAAQQLQRCFKNPQMAGCS